MTKTTRECNFHFSYHPYHPSHRKSVSHVEARCSSSGSSRIANFKRFGEINRAEKALTSLTSGSNYRHVAASRKKELAARGRGGGWRGQETAEG